MPNEMRVKIKGKLAQYFCKHDFHHFETPIDRKANPYGYVSLNDDGIWVCVKCGKGLSRHAK